MALEEIDNVFNNLEEDLVGYIDTESTDAVSQVDEQDINAATRNSKLRQLFEPVADLAVDKISKIPGVTPNRVSFLGNALVGAGCIVLLNSESSNKKSVIATALIATGSAADFIDGALARGTDQTSEFGKLLDLISDKLQETSIAWTLSNKARKHGDHISANNYAVAAMSAPFPALYRAKAESKGIIVKEGGMGTRTSRAVLGIAGAALSQNRSSSTLISALLTSGNLVTTAQRRDAFLKEELSKYCIDQNHDARFKESSKSKRNKLETVSKFSIFAGTAALFHTYK